MNVKANHLKRFSLVLFGCMSLCTSSALAQRVAHRSLDLRGDTAVISPGAAAAPRFLLSVGGAIVGMFAGGYMGYQVLPHDCGCDDPGLEAIIYGGLFGATVGAALGASGPDVGSVCSFDKRFARSFAGSALAGLAAYFVAGGSGSSGTILAVPLTAVGGSLAALGQCWKSHR